MVKHPGLVAVIGFSGALCVFLFAMFAYGEFGAAVSADAPVTIEVRRGESLTRLVRRLKSESVLRNPGFLRALAILRGDAARIKAGEYVLQGGESPSELLDFLISGKAKFISLTVPEGFSISDIARRITEKRLGDAAEFVRLAKDPAFVASLNLPLQPKASSLEGFLFPETYYVHRGADMGRLLKMMVDQFKARAYPLLRENSHRTGLSPYGALVMASIVEKETGLTTERRTISAVFHNRLKARMRLSSDPTVIYGIEDFDGNLTRTHLRTVTAYNTYKVFGLPPTPIASPGLESLAASVFPAKVDYLYFVAKGDGSHFFSKDLKTHNRAVWKYQKRRSRKRRS